MPSIYWAIPGGFAEAGEYKYILENDVYQYLHG
jgi:ADP-ribose pyrophosphatase YjhB (NUDIX family)